MAALSKFRGIITFEAVLFTLLGLIAIAVPQFFTIGIEILVGALFLGGGLIQFIRLFQDRDAPGFWGSLFSALFSAILGALFLFYPIAGVFSLTYLMIFYFFVDGIGKIYFSLQLKSYEKWGWVLFSGILSILLGVLILTGLPGTAIWALGLLIGINMLFFGFSLFGIAQSIPKI